MEVGYSGHRPQMHLNQTDRSSSEMSTNLQSGRVEQQVQNQSNDQSRILSSVQPLGWTLERLEMATGVSREEVLMSINSGSLQQQGAWVVRHPVCLLSAYMTVCGREPQYTTVHAQSKTTVDFIFYSSNCAQGKCLKPIRVLEVPAHHPRCLPSPDFPSDHIFLLADFWIGPP